VIPFLVHRESRLRHCRQGNEDPIFITLRVLQI
jgi:hypothetical protein